jgi:hypothetical protein
VDKVHGTVTVYESVGRKKQTVDDYFFMAQKELRKECLERYIWEREDPPSGLLHGPITQEQEKYNVAGWHPRVLSFDEFYDWCCGGF